MAGVESAVQYSSAVTDNSKLLVYSAAFVSSVSDFFPLPLLKTITPIMISIMTTIMAAAEAIKYPLCFFTHVDFLFLMFSYSPAFSHILLYCCFCAIILSRVKFSEKCVKYVTWLSNDHSNPDIFLYNVFAYPSVIPLIKSVAISILRYKSSDSSVIPSDSFALK